MRLIIDILFVDELAKHAGITLRTMSLFHSIKKNPSEQFAKELETAFGTLFGPDTPYAQLNNCIKRTAKNKEQLPGALKYPNLPHIIIHQSWEPDKKQGKGAYLFIR